MTEFSVPEIIELLNTQDECTWIEAKKGSAIDTSVMETVCSYANEPGLGGGYILLGIEEDENSLFPYYSICGVKDADKVQKDIASQCADSFNIPVRPIIETEMVNSKVVIKIYINELSPEQKPLFFKRKGLPKGAFRRIGSTDQSCTEDDLRVFYNAQQGSFDATVLNDTDWNDIDESAIDLYRRLRANTKPDAEELVYSDKELLLSLNCITRGNEPKLTICGLLLFGTKAALRRCMPMMRVDYIRVPGLRWVEDPDNRFNTIDMRGSLLQLAYRAVDAINSDLPRGFVLNENDIQANNTSGLPYKVLREAVVNSLMHRSYRENRPTQIIRYDNRIEIINPGFSLKPEEMLGEPGSETRNQFIAAVFHETDLAETKGSGIRSMRRLMERSHLAPPTFESSRESNHFVARLLLHHFLNEADLNWLNLFDEYQLNDNQKKALIFVREAGAIDNQTFRQICGVDVLKSSLDLRKMRDDELLEAKGKGRATYYIPGNTFIALSSAFYDESALPITESALPLAESALPITESALPPVESALPPVEGAPVNLTVLRSELTPNLIYEIDNLKVKSKPSDIQNLIQNLCLRRPYRLIEISTLVGRSPKYTFRKYIQPMMNTQIEYLYKDMVNHPDQAYVTIVKK
ncbi:MAG: ATP-binding protein [Parabacteroides sp.]|nr:ATP-binding protein [Parabacteroides sp.]